MQKDSRQWVSKRGKEAGGINIKGVYSRIILVGQKPGSLRTTVENIAKVDAHGYVYTYPAHSVPSWHRVGLGYLHRRGVCVAFDCHGSCQVPCPKIATVTDTYVFFYIPVAKEVIGDY